jgi:hypothetical protein
VPLLADFLQFNKPLTKWLSYTRALSPFYAKFLWYGLVLDIRRNYTFTQKSYKTFCVQVSAKAFLVIRKALAE